MSFVPQNALEETLVHATTDAAARPEFYRLLLESELLVLGKIDGEMPQGGRATLEAGRQVQLASITYKDRNWIPLFSSLDRLRTYLKTQDSYIALNGRALFEMATGAAFLLNPASDYGKELLPEEIASLLNPGTPQRITVDKPTQVLIGQPAVYPQALVDALRAMFATHPEVAAAFLVQIGFPDRPPHPLIGVETASGWDALSPEIGRIAIATMPGTIVDAMALDRAVSGDGVTRALLNTTPFYTRKTN